MSEGVRWSAVQVWCQQCLQVLSRPSVSFSGAVGPAMRPLIALLAVVMAGAS